MGVANDIQASSSSIVQPVYKPFIFTYLFSNLIQLTAMDVLVTIMMKNVAKCVI